jgi:hypothetical protein
VKDTTGSENSIKSTFRFCPWLRKLVLAEIIIKGLYFGGRSQTLQLVERLNFGREPPPAFGFKTQFGGMFQNLHVVYRLTFWRESSNSARGCEA